MLNVDEAFAVLICLVLLAFGADVRLFWAQPQVAAVRVKQKNKRRRQPIAVLHLWGAANGDSVLCPAVAGAAPKSLWESNRDLQGYKLIRFSVGSSFPEI